MSVPNLQEFPEFPTWLNARPSTLQEHRGRALVLAFVNAGSEWCAQRLAELSQWQARNPGRLQLIVVQVPRFDSEREPERALKLLRQHGVQAPILLDREWETWRRFGVASWPTVVLIDAQGRERQRVVGLGGELERELQALCEGQPMPSDEDLRVPPERHPEPRLTLRFPTGLAASADRLFIADSGHHRVLECNHAGRVLRQFGLGTADFMDGGLGEAAFRRPRGLALAREALYVADAGNHALRRVHLSSGRVDTLCGNGRAGEPVEGVVGEATQVSLDSPQGVTVAGNELLVAMAGDNRIWGYDLGRGELRWRAGAGALDERDGSGHLAAFAQPTAVVAVQQTLYVCDALGSAIRSMQLRGDLVQTLVGGQGPWEFGDADGPRHLARLQFPQAIAMDPAGAPVLWIADSGNGSLRSLRLGGGELATVKLPRRLHGPAGLAVAAGSVWIAETDAHAVLRYDIASGELSEFTIQE
ncbi:redoxin domain-containing protein [Stenotrophomonas sp. HITSZ_GD]|uniref:redoxin domain-containing protein n=1 Tax=Stenotrophomonas sp. HITSZ_GD TaxID=3037248 RepID=UPI00240DC5EE|nr:redoxin domain-containing protein [Stenotrophomonas sp. HITSZ_GD]MDG2524369.1 redoxin domain-containing protein [Stenotrophomonas sp. HITSZ_GD]